MPHLEPEVWQVSATDFLIFNYVYCTFVSCHWENQLQVPFCFNIIIQDQLLVMKQLLKIFELCACRYDNTLTVGFTTMTFGLDHGVALSTEVLAWSPISFLGSNTQKEIHLLPGLFWVLKENLFSIFTMQLTWSIYLAVLGCALVLLC